MRKAGLLFMGVIVLDQLALRLFRAPVSTVRYFDFFPLYISWALAIIILVALVLLFSKRPATYPALGLLAGGFISNLVTFTVKGAYLDYIPTGFSYINIADIGIVIGAIWLVWVIKKEA